MKADMEEKKVQQIIIAQESLKELRGMEEDCGPFNDYASLEPLDESEDYYSFMLGRKTYIDEDEIEEQIESMLEEVYGDEEREEELRTAEKDQEEKRKEYAYGLDKISISRNRHHSKNKVTESKKQTHKITKSRYAVLHAKKKQKRKLKKLAQKAQSRKMSA